MSHTKQIDLALKKVSDYMNRDLGVRIISKSSNDYKRIREHLITLVNTCDTILGLDDTQFEHRVPEELIILNSRSESLFHNRNSVYDFCDILSIISHSRDIDESDRMLYLSVHKWFNNRFVIYTCKNPKYRMSYVLGWVLNAFIHYYSTYYDDCESFCDCVNDWVASLRMDRYSRYGSPYLFTDACIQNLNLDFSKELVDTLTSKWEIFVKKFNEVSYNNEYNIMLSDDVMGLKITYFSNGE